MILSKRLELIRKRLNTLFGSTPGFADQVINTLQDILDLVSELYNIHTGQPKGGGGSQGPIGPTGDVGPQGDPGPPGDTGPQGDPGPQGDTGPQGLQGFQGAQGIQGVQGDPGADGAAVLNGAGDPTTEGIDGDFYINTTSDTIFGPKTSGVWGSGTPLVGPQGDPGVGFADGDYGDIVISLGVTVLTIDNDAVDNTKLADMAQSTIKGRTTVGTGDPENLTAAQTRTILNVADGADVTQTVVTAAASKTTPVDADTVLITDSAASNVLKKTTWANIKATLKTYFDTLYNLYVHPNHSGDVTSTGDGATVIGSNKVSNAMLATIATARIRGRITAATGNVEDLTATQARSVLNVADGANAYVHPNHSGDVTSTGDGATVIGSNKVTDAKLADMAQSTIKGRTTVGTGDPENLTAAQTRTILNVADGATANQAASTTEVLTGTDSTKFVTSDALAALWEKGSDVASAATVSLGEGRFFHITGTTTITDIQFATPKDGRMAILYFDGILTLTHNGALLILPTTANILTAAGDIAIVVQNASTNRVVVAFQRKSGQALAGVLTSGGTMTGPLVLPAGSAAAPSLDMNGQGGLFSSGAGEFNFAVGGAEIGSVNAFGIGIGGDAASGQQLVVSSTGIARIVLNGDSTTNFLQTRYSNNATGGSQSIRKSRGTKAIPAAVNQNDALGDVLFLGRGTTAFQTGGRHFATVIAATPSDTDMQTRLLGSCSPAASVTLTEIYRYDHATGFSLFGANPVIDQNRLHRMRSYTVATLPAAGTAGRRAMVTDALAPAFLGALTGGGAVVTPVFDNGTAWVAG